MGQGHAHRRRHGIKCGYMLCARPEGPSRQRWKGSWGGGSEPPISYGVWGSTAESVAPPRKVLNLHGAFRDFKIAFKTDYRVMWQ